MPFTNFTVFPLTHLIVTCFVAAGDFDSAAHTPPVAHVVGGGVAFTGVEILVSSDPTSARATIASNFGALGDRIFTFQG